MVTLPALSRTDADELVTAAVAAFVDALAANGVDPDEAGTAIDDMRHRLLPDGVRTEGHEFRSIVLDDGQVGRVWFGPLPGAPGDWYLFEFEIAEGERGRGIGRMALEAVIAELEDRGAARVGLNVAESNRAAVALYESIGFEHGATNASGHDMWLKLPAAR